MTIISDKIVKAKKQHKCYFCTGIIEAGEKYKHQVNKQDDLFVFKTHINCNELAEKLKWYEDCWEGLSDDSFQESVRNEYHTVKGIPYNASFRKGDKDYVPFKDQLQFIINHHLIEKNNEKVVR